MPGQPHIIYSRRVVTPGGVQAAGVWMQYGRITQVGPLPQRPAEATIEDVGDLVVMPGLIDPHVHINEPGRTHWEGFETATKAAAAGGVTTLIDMPLNSDPVTTTVAALQQKWEAMAGTLWVDCGCYGGVVPGNQEALLPLIEAGVWGLKAFLVHSGLDTFLAVSEADLQAAMPLIAEQGLPLLVHAELASPITPTSGPLQPQSYATYLASRPRDWEQAAIALMVDLCRTYQCRVHIVHLSSADAVSLLQEAREEGLPLSVETGPHYLFFAAEDIPDGDTRFKCAPPIRERENNTRLWEALRANTIDFIATDHSPCEPGLKCLETGDFEQAWGGIAGLQFTLPVTWTGARQRGFTLSHVAQWLAQRPAEFLGLDHRKGKIAPGSDADLVIWNPEATFTPTLDRLYHRHPITPYTDCTLYGVVEQTYLRGHKVYDAGRFSDNPSGQILRRNASP